jgi:ribosome-associated heat shock protein Hsp15
MAGPGAKQKPEAQPKLRLDKWLFHARFFRSREAAAEVAEGGHLRINAQRCLKPGHGLAVGDVLTFPQGGRIRVVRVAALSDRRGPAAEAAELYEDLDPPDPAAAAEPLE